MSNDRGTWSPILIVLGLLLFILGLIGVDVVADYRAGTPAAHIAVELLVMALAAGGVSVLWYDYHVQRKLITVLQRDVTVVRSEAAQWQADAERVLGDLAVAVDRQFVEWALTIAERDIAFALLRGLSHKEIAQIRQTSERTVREQARAIYQKAGLDGRSALAAFFLWNLIPPPQAKSQ